MPATLSLTLGAPAAFGAFTPGIAKDYFATTTATVTSTAGDAALSVADPSSRRTPASSSTGRSRCRRRCRPGHRRHLRARSRRRVEDLDAAPVSNDAVAIGFKQSIGANEPLRTGTYSKTLTFTLSTTNP